MIDQTPNTTAAATSRVSLPGFTIAQIVLSALGFIDAGLLLLQDRKKVDLPCTSDGGCEIVAQSIYSHVTLFGQHIPVAAVGAAGYLAILTLAMIKMGSETRRMVDLVSIALLLITGGGALYSWYLQYVSFHIIGHHCIYCIISASIMTVLMIVTIAERFSLRSLWRGPNS